MTPNDPFFTRLWGLHNAGQTVNWTAGTPDADIDAPAAWSVSTGSPDVVVAVIDTGVDTTHPDLAQNTWVNEGEDCSGCRTNGIDDDGNGYVDDWRGWDFANGDNNPADDNGHGTHVAGTDRRGQATTALGVAGVTWSSRIMPLKFLGADGSGTTADAISAILYARAKGVPILNNSWGGGDFSQALLDAIEQTDASGALFVAAAGNDFTNTDAEPFYPAGYEVPNVLVVGASDQFDRKAWFSNYGTRTVDLSAPGTNIYSTWPGAHVSLRRRHLDGRAAGLGRCGARQGRVPGRERRRAEGAAPARRRSDRRAEHGLADRRTAERRPRRQVRRHAAGVDRLAANGTELSAGQPLEIRVLGALCGSPGGVSVSATLNGSPFALAARGDGLYSATYSRRPVRSTSTVTATAGASSDIQSVTAMANQSYRSSPAATRSRSRRTRPERTRGSLHGQAGPAHQRCA